MIYEQAKYIKDVLFGTIVGIECTLNNVTLFVPLDPANTDYQLVMKLVEDGELTIADAEEVTTE